MHAVTVRKGLAVLKRLATLRISCCHGSQSTQQTVWPVTPVGVTYDYSGLADKCDGFPANDGRRHGGLTASEA